MLRLSRNYFKRFYSIDGFGRVSLPNKSEKLVKNLQEGDLIQTTQGPAKVVEIKSYHCPMGFYELVELNKMLINPNQQIRLYDEWTIARDVKEVQFLRCHMLYSFVLDKYNEMIVNGNVIKSL